MTILTATRPLPKTKTKSVVDVPIWRISVAQYHQMHTTDLIPVILDGIEIGRIPVNDVLPPQLVSQSKG